MKEKIKKIIYYILIVVVAIFISIPLLNKHLDVYFDDGIQHIARAYSVSLSLEKGESTIVLSNLINGYGYSWDLFYGALSTWGILLFNFFVKNYVVAYKLLLFTGSILSGITMYIFVKRITENKNTACLASVLYMTMPYHLNDMYIRNALGEFLSFVFIPLVFLGLYNIFHKDKKDYFLLIGTVRTYFNTQFNDTFNCTFRVWIFSYKFGDFER